MSRFVRHYRRVNATKALKTFSPLFSLSVDEVFAGLTRGIR